MATLAAQPDRPALVRRAIFLESGIIAYNCVEGILSVVAGIIAGSVTLVGFGFDSAIEVSAAVVVVYHLTRSREGEQPYWERRVAGFVGLTLLALAAYVAVRAVFELVTHTEASESWLGVGITAASVVVMSREAKLRFDGSITPRVTPPERTVNFAASSLKLAPVCCTRPSKLNS